LKRKKFLQTGGASLQEKEEEEMEDAGKGSN